MSDYVKTLADVKNAIEGSMDVYVSIASKVNNISREEAERVIESELKLYLNRANKYISEQMADSKVTTKPTITKAQGINIFLEVIASGLSFSVTASHIYLSRLKGTGTAVGYQMTADGMLFSAQKAGAIDHLSEAVIVMDGEDFEIQSSPDGRHIVSHRIIPTNEPFNFDKMWLGYVYLVYPNGDRELSWISKSKLAKAREKSTNKGMYNDESFVQTKIIKHALRKVRKTGFMTSALIEEEDLIAEHREYDEYEPVEVEVEQEEQPATMIETFREPF